MKYQTMKSVMIAAILGSGTLLMAQTTYPELKAAAEQKLKEKNGQAALELYQRALNAKDAGEGGKDWAYYKLASIYAWGLPENDFKKAAAMIVEKANLPSKKALQKANDLKSAADYMLRDKDPDRKQVVLWLDPMTKNSELSAKDKIDLYNMMIRAIYPVDSAAADRFLAEAIALNGPIDARNSIRTNLGQLKKQTSDIDGAVAAFSQITEDKESSPVAKANAQMEIARTLANAKPARLKDADEALKKALAIPGIQDNEKASVAFLQTELMQKEKKPDFQAVANILKATAESKNLVPLRRVEAYRRLITVMQKNLKAPKTAILPLLKDMWAIEKPDANAVREMAALAGSYLRDQSDFDDAFKAFSKYSDFVKDEKSKIVVTGWNASVYEKMENYLKAAELYKEAAIWPQAAGALRKAGQNKEADKLLLDAYAKGFNPGAVMHGLVRENSNKRIQELLQNELKPILAEKPDLGNSLAGRMGDAMQYADYDFALMLVPYVLNAGSKDQRNYNRALLYRINALAQLGRKAEAVKYIQEAAKDPNITDLEFALRFKVLNDALVANTKQGAFDAAKKALDEFKKKGVFELPPPDPKNPDKERKSPLNIKNVPQILSRAASTAVLLNNRDVTEGIEDFRKSLYTPMPNKKMKCEYVNNLPSDIDGWMASDIIKNKKGMMPLDRQLWESDVEFLLATDAAVTGRGVKESKDAKGISTELYSYCDDKGVYIFMLAFDNNAKAVSERLAGGGSYEGYMAPGPTQPYHCFLIDIASGKADDFNTAYKNDLTRRPTFADNELKTSTKLVADNANATIIFYPWEYYFNVLPDNKGDAWQFDVMRWTGPGASWSGTKSVHNRSTWGDLVFDLTPAQLTAIRKNIVFKALTAYKTTLGSRWRGTGLFNFWSDPDLGDPAFYQSKLEPLKEKLDAEAALIKIDMDDATVNRIFLETVPQFFNLPFIVAEMRRDYLNDRQFTE